MKQLTNSRIIVCAALAGLVSPLSAADSSISSSQERSQSTHAQTSSQRQHSSQNLSVNKILDASAKSRDGESLGNVEDVLVNPQTGRISFVILGQGGVLGIGEERIPVPWQAVNVQSDGSLTVNQDKAKLQSAPSVKRDYSNLNEPGYTVTIYEFYAIPVGGSMGGTRDTDESQKGRDASGNGQERSGQYSTNSNSSNRNQ